MKRSPIKNYNEKAIVLTQRIFITATNTDIGKTYATKLLIKEFTLQGYRVGVFKPIETGVIDKPIDGSELLSEARKYNPELKQLNVNEIVPVQFRLPAAPYVASNAAAIDLQIIDKALHKVESHCDIVLIEGAGGLMVPIDQDKMMIDLISHFQAKALLISHCKLGCINDTLLSIAALEHAGLAYKWALNCRDDDNSFAEVSEPYFKEQYPLIYKLSNDITALAKALLQS